MQARSVRVVAERNHDEPFSRAARTALRRSLDPATPWIVPRLACAGIEDSPDPCSIIALRFRRNVKSAMSGQNLLTQKTTPPDTSAPGSGRRTAPATTSEASPPRPEPDRQGRQARPEGAQAQGRGLRIRGHRAPQTARGKRRPAAISTGPGSMTNSRKRTDHRAMDGHGPKCTSFRALPRRSQLYRGY